MSDKSSPMRKVVGWGLVLLGALWVLLTGGCTVVFVGTAISGLMREPSGGAQDLVLSFFTGLICVAPGVAALWVGIDMVRRPRTPPAA